MMHRAQLAEAIPVETSGVKLPLDLRLIASRCKNSYYAPKRFSAVQLAYSEPRCRVLVFRKSHFRSERNQIIALRDNTCARACVCMFACKRRYGPSCGNRCAYLCTRACVYACLCMRAHAIDSHQYCYPSPNLCAGTSGPGAARVALLRAQRQLYKDAGIKIHVRNFAVRAPTSPPHHLTISPPHHILRRSPSTDRLSIRSELSVFAPL